MKACDTLKAHSNHAAALIVQGKHQEAFEELQLAIENAVSSGSWSVDVVPAETTVHSAFDVMALTTSPTNVHDDIFRWPIISLASNARTARQQLNSMSTACAVALFNMGLCCHLSLQEKELPAQEHNALLTQAESVYLKGMELGVHCNVPLLNLALSANLMDISFAWGNLTALYIWFAYFQHEMGNLPRNTPKEVFSAFCRSHFLYSGAMVAARAA
eukprot:scaffold2069_cov187-Amphora_coffeaeformis.AAC.47